MAPSIRNTQSALALGPWVVWAVMLLGLPFDLFAQTPDSTGTNPTDTLTNRPYVPSRRPTYRPADRYGDPFSNTTTQSPLYLKDPSRMDVEIDTSGNYTIYEKIGDLNYRPTSSMSLQEFKQYQDRQLLREYWKTRSRAQDGESAVSGRSVNPKIFISPVLDRIFGGSYVELIPRGFVTLDFGGTFQRINSPTIPIRQQRNGGFEFNQQINMSVVGKVGEKLAITANFDNNNSFDFQNNMKVEYTGFKEDILQKLEIGNVSLPLNNTLIQGSQNLFGIKAQLQFGKLNVTTIATTQRGKTSSIDINGGGPGGSAAQGRPFEIIASNYDENRHFFLGHYFRKNYQDWVANSPQIISGVNVTQIEVYVLNRATETQTLRNVVAFMDLAEGETIYNGNIGGATGPGPNNNNANNLFANLTADPNTRGAGLDATLNALGLVNGLDYEKINGARKLAPTEYTIHPQLGYITLNRKLQNDEALAVAYEYASGGGRHKVGELSLDNTGVADDQVIFLKMLRPRKVAVRDTEKRIIPTWLLMMKNIYSLGVNQVAQDGFQLRIIYKDDKTGIDNPQLQEGPAEVRTKQLVELFGLDRLNPVNDPMPDGNFDFVEGITINAANGLIIFPRLEPFSESLREAFNGNTTLIRKYAYDTLYRTTKAAAELFATQNKFWLEGFYNASGGSAKEILIPGFGVAPGSVKLYAGNIPLVENVDYVVDYTFGKVTILNDAILSSGKDIQVQYEQNDPFAFQTRSLLGTRFDYKLNDDINFGSTFLYYNERPLVTRNQIGTEPARNIQYGFDFNINKESRLLTKLVDAIPLIQTKEQSSINITGEFAQLLPGTSNVVDGEGTAFIDDFESSATPYSLMNPFGWKLASVPRYGNYSPVSGEVQNDLQLGYRRAKIAWYSLDNQLQRESNQFRPDNISDNDIKNHYVRGVYPQEIFPKRQNPQAVFFEQILDIAYFPEERGPYNYNWGNLNNGLLVNPRGNWAGITTAIRTEVDFDKANIEYVEFWLLDPFIANDRGKVIDGRLNRSNSTGGKVRFQLGSISEDVQRDGKHAFENGLPPNGNYDGTSVTENTFGYVTNQNFLTNGFDNTNPGSRKYQDVGLDGAPNERERELFAPTVPVPDKDAADPSADDYRHFLDNSYDRADAKILERYKDYNGQDGNTPVQTGTSNIALASYQTPDNEDLNADNTLSELEEYYEYEIDLTPSNLVVGNEYIVDKQYNAEENVTWYLFRIPVREYETRFGEIDGFKSIRYARMILTDFAEPVVLRMANFRMVGSRWRRYEGTVFDDGIIPFPEGISDNFSVSVVNLEENSEADEEGNKSGYVIPPGAIRDRDNSSAVSRLLNEQSIQVCIDDLLDGEGRAIYKNMAVDLFNYGRIKMFLHANSEAEDDELTAFLRLGTDFDQNYYEIEIPLKITPIQSNSSRDVWPEANEIDLDLDELYGLKAARDREGFSLGEPYPATGPRTIGRHGLRIMGRPDLSSVQVIMIGVRNPKSADKEMHSVCIWANELRVTDFDRTAGWAVSSTVTAKLADFAVVNGAFRHTSFGFGGVSSKIFERTRDRSTNYDIGANINLDKLIPGNTGIKVPMFVSYENTLITPEYDPANPDMRIDAMLKSFNMSDPEDRKRKSDYLSIIEDKTTRRSLNFMNVRKVKVKPDAPTHIWDIENFAFSYSFSEQVQRNFNTTENLLKNQGGSVNYQFAPKASGIEPFKDSKSLSSPWLRLIKDFNFNLMPTTVAAQMDLNRTFSKRVYRNVGSNGEFVNSTPNYMKSFTFNRNYTLGWDLTKSLSFQYNSRVFAVIDEPEGDINTKAERDSVLSNLKRFGRMKNFNQSVTLNYKVPLEKIPVFDWVSLDYRYQVMYDWKAGPINIDEKYNFANIIQNSREQDYSGKLDLVRLYNKVKFLKELNTPPKPAPTVRPGTNPKAQPPVDTTRSSVPGLIKGFVKLMMSVRSINGTYTVSDGTTLPGFNRTPSLLGMDGDWSAPGWGFIFGSQDPNFRKDAAAKGWLTTNPLLTTPFSQSHMVNLNIRGMVEPARDLKIQLDLKKETISSYQEIYRNSDTGGGVQFESLNPNRSGSYRVSTISIRTAFNRSNSDVDSEIHKHFERNLEIIYNRFNRLVENSPVGYDSAQDVLIPAFIAAYTGADAKTISLSPFPKNPAPNWRVDYTGLTQIEFFKNIFQSITISHAYQSVYSITNYTNSLAFDDAERLSIDRKVEDYNRKYFSPVVDNKRLPIFVINQVLISEQFTPLIGVNVRTKSRLTANLQYKTKRDLALNISNAQVTELTSKDVSLEVGFTKTNMRLPFKAQGRRVVLKNDVTFRMNTSIGDTRTIQRKIGELDVITNGNINFQLRPNVSYTVNQKLTVQVYFERNVNEPLVSISAPRSTTRFGAQIRFSLAQ